MFKINNNGNRKTSVLESLFNKVAGLQAWNIVEKRLQHRRHFGIFIINFERISNILVVFLLLNLNNDMSAALPTWNNGWWICGSRINIQYPIKHPFFNSDLGKNSLSNKFIVDHMTLQVDE